VFDKLLKVIAVAICLSHRLNSSNFNAMEKNKNLRLEIADLLLRIGKLEKEIHQLKQVEVILLTLTRNRIIRQSMVLVD
jgi:hypothetical protein